MVFTAVCVVTDVKDRRIPNVITLPMILVGYVYMGIVYGWSGLGDAAVGMLLLSVPYLMVFILGGMGGGDVKLMAAVGVWLGPVIGIWVLVLTVCWGLVLSLVAAGMYGRIRELPFTMVASAFRIHTNARRMLGMMKSDVSQETAEETGVPDGRKPIWIPYAPAILLGVISGGVLWAYYGEM